MDGATEWGYAASEARIIKLVESHLSSMPVVGKLGIPAPHLSAGTTGICSVAKTGLLDQSPKPKHVWNRIPDGAA
jgi:hypothetical protein